VELKKLQEYVVEMLVFGGTRISVWVLVNARNLGISEAQLLKDYPTLSATDLTNAWVYASIYSEEIETAIRENEEA
jgi:uncharacterized protein (DUF433 family)